MQALVVDTKTLVCARSTCALARSAIGKATKKSFKFNSGKGD